MVWACVVALALAAVACSSSSATSSDPIGSSDVTSTSVAPPGLPAVPRVSMFGDSTALMTSWGLLAELERTHRGEFVEGFTGLGCSVIRTSERRIAGDVAADDPTCDNWATVWKSEIDTDRPDITVVQTGSWDVADRKLPGEDVWRSPGDPAFDAYALSEMLAAVDLLSSNGAAVVWLTSPVPGVAAYASPKVQAFDPAPRHQRFNQLIEQLPSIRPGKVAVVDLAAWIASQTPDQDAVLRPDGVHFSHDASVGVCQQYLCDAILQAARQLQPGPPPDRTPPTTAPITPVPGPGEPDARARARAQLVGQYLPDAGLAASQAGWRVRVDADETFDATPNSDDELVLWWWTGVVNEVR
jgi:hypothetical protein